jgi:DegV family protein with EDD domain
MTKVAIVTDSTAYLPDEHIQENSITVVPLQVIWGEESFLDGVDITPQTFYERLRTSDLLPSTSQPSPAAFTQVYSKLLNDGYDILSLHISSGLSGTVASAFQARELLPDGNIEIIDTLSTTMTMGFQVLKAARAAKNGATLQECKALANTANEHSGVFFAVSTLEFLHRGGRIGGGAAFLGNMLNLKPVLGLEEGKIQAVERIRTMHKALDRLIELAENDMDMNGPIYLATISSNAEEDARKLLQRAIERLGEEKVKESYYADISPVIGTHTGPGTIGLCYSSGFDLD